MVRTSLVKKRKSSKEPNIRTPIQHVQDNQMSHIHIMNIITLFITVNIGFTLPPTFKPAPPSNLPTLTIMATPTTAPPAMCTLNEKGMKQYQKRIKAASDKPDPAMGEYESAKLPAHKAAFDGNTAGLEAVFISSVKNGGVTVADKGISPLHMAIKGNKMEAVK